MSMLRILCVVLAGLALAASGVAAGSPSAGPAERAEPVLAWRAPTDPLRLAEIERIAPLAELRPAVIGALDQLEALAAWNRAGRLPLKNGFRRPLPSPRQVSFAGLEPAEMREVAGGIALRTPDGGAVWSAVVEVAEAHRLRFELDVARLPAAAQLWVWGSHGPAQGPFGVELAGPDGTLWTPSVAGEAIYLEVTVPRWVIEQGAPAELGLRSVLELVALDRRGLPLAGPTRLEPKEDTSCLLDATCVGTETLEVIDAYRQAVAFLFFVRDDGGFVCTGGLLNTTEGPVAPYLLTANHCFGTQEVASSLEAFWDLRSSTCGGERPALDSLPKSVGSTLLATSADTDFTLVELDNLPPDRVFLGWTTEPPSEGTVLHRIAHSITGEEGEEEINVQSYSRYELDTSFPACIDGPRPDYLYLDAQEGGTFGGSSGAPVILATGHVVGQLSGGCGPSPGEGCDDKNRDVDGAFSITFPSVAQWLDPQQDTGPCEPSDTVLCLNNGRFRVEVIWRDFAGQSGQGKVVPFGSNDSGMFWFFDSDNWEMLIKVLDACDLFDRYWVFAAATTDVEYTLTVTDTQHAGEFRQYVNPLGQASPAITDTNAFATCP